MHTLHVRLLLWLMLPLTAGSGRLTPEQGAPAAVRHRVIVSTDIGGTDPDDFQSMVHFLVYADMFDVEGLISSPYGPGRREHILQVIDKYAVDYANLKSHSERYPLPDDLRRLTKQGALDSATGPGVRRSTEGSDWIVRAARRDDPRPLWVLVWGGIDDLAQALHDAPDILPKLRVYFIGGPNKMWSVDAYNYIEQHHPALWMIEANATYRGWFTGGSQAGEWDNTAFVAAHIAGRGALGEYFATQLKGTIKMGDSPSVGYLLHGTPDDPSQPGWGGRFVRVWDGRKTVFDRLTTETDKAEVFGVVELNLPAPAGMTSRQSARMMFDGRIPALATRENGVLRFRFSPRDAKVWPYVILSDVPALDGRSGSFTAVAPPVERTSRASAVHPNWWIDDPDPAVAEGVHPGAKSVNQWREAFLRDFAARMRRAQAPAPGHAAPRARVLVLTDIENEPDDAMSMVRLLTYANQWDVEGLVATTSVHQRDKTAAWRIREIVEAYRTVRDNLGDPDGHTLAYEWFYHGEPGTLLLSSGRTGAPLRIESATSVAAWFTAPAVTKTETMHIVLAVTDQGTPPLTRYQRVMVTVHPSAAAAGAPQVGWGPPVLQQTQEWYASPQARTIADSVLLCQSPVGAWPKNTDLCRPRAAAASAAEAAADPNGNTIDNDATTLPMEFLARMVPSTTNARSNLHGPAITSRRLSQAARASASSAS